MVLDMLFDCMAFDTLPNSIQSAGLIYKYGPLICTCLELEFLSNNNSYYPERLGWLVQGILSSSNPIMAYSPGVARLALAESSGQLEQ